MEAFGFTARGILEALDDAEDDGVGRLWTAMFDLGVEVSGGTNEKSSFNFSAALGREICPLGVGGASSELVSSREGVRSAVIC